MFIPNLENEIDGETLLGLSETMAGELVPSMKYRVKLMQALKLLQNGAGLQNGDPAGTKDAEPAVNCEAVCSLIQGKRKEDLMGYKLPTMPPCLQLQLAQKDKKKFLPAKLARAQLVEVIFNSVVSLSVL